MSITRNDVVAALAVHPRNELAAVLSAAVVDARGASTSRELAERIAEALWWHSTTPLGYAIDRTDLEAIVRRVARRVGMQHRVEGQDAWEQVRALSHHVFATLPGRGVGLDDLDDATRRRLEPDWMPSIGMGIGATGTAGTGWAAGRALALLRGPFGRLIPLLPPLAPAYQAIVAALGTVRVVAWPLAGALAFLSLNQSLGANDRKLVPLLLGVGALAPTPVEPAVEV